MMDTKCTKQNTMNSVLRPFLSAFLLIASSFACARVTPDGALLVPRDYGSIQAAHDALPMTGGLIRLEANTVFPLDSTLLISKPNVEIVGTQTSIVVVMSNTMSDCAEPGARAAICVTGNRARLRGFHLDGNQGRFGAGVFGIVVTGTDAVLESLDIASFANPGKAYGGGVQLRNAIRAQIATLNIHECDGDGLSIFGATSRAMITNLQVWNIGAVGIDIEGSGSAHPNHINIAGLQTAGNSSNHILVIHSEDVVVTGWMGLAGAGIGSNIYSHDCNNGCFKVRGSSRVTLTGFDLRGGGAEQNPHGIWLDDEGSTDRNHDVAIGPGIISGMAGDCVRFDRPGSTGGSTDVSIQGVRGTSCKGYGLNVTVPEIVEHLQVSNSNFRLNNADAFSGIGQTSGREAWNVTPTIDVPVDDLATAENGTVLYCSDCLQSDPCRKGGTGALAKRVRGMWSCK